MSLLVPTQVVRVFGSLPARCYDGTNSKFALKKYEYESWIDEFLLNMNVYDKSAFVSGSSAESGKTFEEFMHCLRKIDGSL